MLHTLYLYIVECATHQMLKKIFAELMNILVNGEIVEARKELRKVFLD